MLMDEVGNDIDTIATMFISTKSQKDPYWENSAREMLKAFLWAMLEDIEHYQLETIPIVPKSVPAHFEPGECIITEANSGYVLYSQLERYYLLDEMKNLPTASEREYECAVNPFDKKYMYVVTKSNGRRHPFDFGF